MNCITLVIDHNYFGDEVIEWFGGKSYRMEHDASDLLVALKKYPGVVFAHYPAIDFINGESWVKVFALIPHVEEHIRLDKEHMALMQRLSLEGKLDNQPFTRGMEMAGHYGY